MRDYYLVNTRQSENYEVPDLAAVSLLFTIPAEGQHRILESGKPPVLNPLTDPSVKEALTIISRLEGQLESQKLEYLSNRSTLRKLCDQLIGGTDSFFFLKRNTVESELRQTRITDNADGVLNELHKAGLIDIFKYLPDSDSGAGMMAGSFDVVRVTERGKTLLTVVSQPAILLSPEV